MGKELQYGDATAVNELAGLIGPVEEEDEFLPAGDEESFLFSPSDRVAEPITAGMPFGDGPDVSRHAFQTDEELVTQVAARIATDKRAPKTLKDFSRRALEGQ
jgi:hypothetical protein